MERGTDSLYLALAEKELYDGIGNEKRQELEMFRNKDYNVSFTADSCSIFFARTCCAKHTKEHDQRESGLFKQEFNCTKMLFFCNKTYCCYSTQRIKFKFNGKGLKKRKIMASYRKVLGKTEIVFSTNRGCRTKKCCVATYEQTKKRFSPFNPKRMVDSDGVHTLPLQV